METEVRCTSLRQGLELFQILSQALHMKKRNAFGCIFQVSFSHVCTIRNTPRFWECLLLANLCSHCIPHYGWCQECYSNCSAKKHYLEVHKMSSTALTKHIKQVQAGNGTCAPVLRTCNVKQNQLGNSTPRTTSRRLQGEGRHSRGLTVSGTTANVVCSLLTKMSAVRHKD